MSLVNSMINHVRRQNTPSARFLYKLGMGIYGFPFPMIKPLHSLLYHEWNFRTELWHNFWRIVYYEPMFKS